MNPALTYAPSRGLGEKIARRMTQAHVARPARVKLPRGALSVCFDDFPVSAAEAGAAALERFDARGTFYAAAGMSGEDGPAGKCFSAAQLRRLAASGHEIGCHTYGHVDCAKTDADEFISECARNAIELALFGHRAPLRSLAFPFGETNRHVKDALPDDFTSARGINPGLNHGWVDLAQLKAYPFYGWAALEPLLAALQKAHDKRAWMIVFTHDVGQEPSKWGAPLGALGALLRRARDLKMDISPVGDIADRIIAANE
ncbi:MAG: polysaccharide deacetylase family protein [Hyphomonadaceae bacterium]